MSIMGNISKAAQKLGGDKLQQAAVSGMLKLKKASPTIAVGLGVVSCICSTVLACKATLEIEPILVDAKEDLEKVHQGREQFDEETYSEMSARRDTAIIYTRTGVGILKKYAPAIGLGVTGIGLILGSHRAMTGRVAALSSAYEGVRVGFKSYRERVREALGESKDREFLYGLKAAELEKETTDENGETKVEKEDILTFDPNKISRYARFFDELSTEWTDSSEYNLMKIRTVQQWANDKLWAEGYLFLNEVYEALGLPKTSEGQLVGWMRGMGDDYVDFNLYNGAVATNRDFVNGYEKSILLDFNVDGDIFRYV